MTLPVENYEGMFQVPDRVISSVKQLTDFLSLNTNQEQEEQERQREKISVQQIETFMNNEGFQDSEAILPNFEFKKILTTKRPSVVIKKEQTRLDNHFIRDLDRQTSSVKNKQKMNGSEYRVGNKQKVETTTNLKINLQQN